MALPVKSGSQLGNGMQFFSGGPGSTKQVTDSKTGSATASLGEKDMVKTVEKKESKKRTQEQLHHYNILSVINDTLETTNILERGTIHGLVLLKNASKVGVDAISLLFTFNLHFIICRSVKLEQSNSPAKQWMLLWVL